jgi:hypothetical protein
MARPWTGLLMAIAVAILFGTLSRVWAGDDLVHVGPPGVEVCIAGVTSSGPPGPVECKPEPQATLSGDLTALRWIVLLGGFAAAAACAYSALQLAREHEVPYGLGLVVLAITAVAMVAFAIRLLTSHPGLSIGIGCPVGLGGAIAGFVMFAVLRARRDAPVS